MGNWGCIVFFLIKLNFGALNCDNTHFNAQQKNNWIARICLKSFAKYISEQLNRASQTKMLFSFYLNWAFPHVSAFVSGFNHSIIHIMFQSMIFELIWHWITQMSSAKNCTHCESQTIHRINISIAYIVLFQKHNVPNKVQSD